MTASPRERIGDDGDPARSHVDIALNADPGPGERLTGVLTRCAQLVGGLTASGPVENEDIWTWIGQSSAFNARRLTFAHL